MLAQRTEEPSSWASQLEALSAHHCFLHHLFCRRPRTPMSFHKPTARLLALRQPLSCRHYHLRWWTGGDPHAARVHCRRELGFSSGFPAWSCDYAGVPSTQLQLCRISRIPGRHQHVLVHIAGSIDSVCCHFCSRDNYRVRCDGVLEGTSVAEMVGLASEGYQRRGCRVGVHGSLQALADWPLGGAMGLVRYAIVKA